jgi:hypothetical protein
MRSECHVSENSDGRGVRGSVAGVLPLRRCVHRRRVPRLQTEAGLSASCNRLSVGLGSWIPTAVPPRVSGRTNALTVFQWVVILAPDICSRLAGADAAGLCRLDAISEEAEMNRRTFKNGGPWAASIDGGRCG